ncbi:MAG: hypothetical protein LBU31_02710 [Coriobacteriales bacterium]|jgi:hypothetical protein|nr:hypothetical protein [Coriobacteriales bacterium]
MTETAKKKSVWRKPPTDTDRAGGDRQEHRERRYSILSNLLTLLLTGVIITGGILFPNLLYPYLDRYRNTIVQIPSPTESEHTFDEPVSLYPWNLYEEQRLRALTSAERDLLDGRGIPDFLIATLRDHGMTILPDGPDVLNYRALILGSFRYLEPGDSAEPGCYVLYDVDIDAEGQPDLRCAVDFQANIISLLFVSDNLSAVEVGTPVGTTPSTTPDGTSGTPTDNTTGAATSGGQTPDATQQQENTQSTATGKPADTAGTDNENSDTSKTPTVGIEGDTGTAGDAGADGTAEAGATTGTSANPEVEVTTGTSTQPDYQPPEEERHLWSFAYTTSREAKAFDQPSLMRAFRQLECTYENRWGYPYTSLLAAPPEEPETDFPGDEYTPLLPPTPFKTADYLLNIYDLPDGNRLILYLDPSTSHCKGFNLQTS